MQTIKTFIIPHSHPSIAGHFPGHPVVPGVVLLEQVEIALTEQLQNWEIMEIVQTKFIELVLPEKGIEIQLNNEFLINPHSISFQLIDVETLRKVVIGKVKLAIIKGA